TDLVVQAYHAAGRAPVGIGLFAGAVGYYALTSFLDRRAEREDPEVPVVEAAARGPETLPRGADATATRNLSVGMVLDRIPESVAIALTLLASGSVSVALVAAVFLSNLPEAIGVAAAMLAGKRALRDVLARFAVIVAVCALAAAAGYALLQPTDKDVIAVIQSIAAGAMVVVIV